MLKDSSQCRIRLNELVERGIDKSLSNVGGKNYTLPINSKDKIQLEQQLSTCTASSRGGGDDFQFKTIAGLILNFLFFWSSLNKKNKILEADANSLNELIGLEPAEKPPTLIQLRETTNNRFSDKWIKYMYAKFKNVRLKVS